MKQGSKIYWH